MTNRYSIDDSLATGRAQWYAPVVGRRQWDWPHFSGLRSAFRLSQESVNLIQRRSGYWTRATPYCSSHHSRPRLHDQQYHSLPPLLHALFSPLSFFCSFPSVDGFRESEINVYLIIVSCTTYPLALPHTIATDKKYQAPINDGNTEQGLRSIQKKLHTHTTARALTKNVGRALS